MKIFVIYHKILEDSNVFITNPEKIADIAVKLCEETNTDISEWKIRVLTEGKKFNADMNI